MDNIQQVQVQEQAPVTTRRSSSGLRELAALQGGDAFAQIFAQMAASLMQTDKETGVQDTSGGGEVLMMQALAGLFLQTPSAEASLPQPLENGVLAEASPVLTQLSASGLPAEALQFLKEYQTQSASKGPETVTFAGAASEDASPVMQVQVLGYQQERAEDPGAGLYQQGKFLQSVQTAQKLMQDAQTQDRRALEDIDVDKLPGKVLTAEFQPRLESKGFLSPADQEPALADQIRDGAAENLALGKREFVIKLKPAGLGEITVKLEETQGKTVLNLIASSQETAKILNNELNSLKEAMRPLQVEVQQAVTRQEPSQAQTGGGNPQNFAQPDMSGQFHSGQHLSERDRGDGTLPTPSRQAEEPEDARAQVYAGSELDISI